MKACMRRVVLGTVVVVLFLGPACVLHGMSELPELGIYDIVGELQFTQVLMRSAVLGRAPDDIRVHTEEVARLLGPTDSTSGGLISSLRWLGDHPVEAGVIQRERYDEFSLIVSRAVVLLERAAAACSEVLEALRTNGDAEDARERAYAYIAAAIGSADDPFALAGLTQAMAYVARTVKQLAPGENIQTAIDELPENGLIYLQPGTYEAGSLSLRRSLTLAVAPGAEGRVILVGDSAHPVLAVSGAGVRAALRGLIVREGSVGLEINESAAVQCIDCEFTRNVSAGLRASADSHVVMIQSSLFDNGRVGLIAADRAFVTVIDSTINLNGDYSNEIDPSSDSAGVRLCDDSEAWVSNTQLWLNRGHAFLLTESSRLVGIALTMDFNSGDCLLLFDAVQLQLVDCRLTQILSYGIRAYGSTCVPETGEWMPERAFTGRITGSMNFAYQNSNRKREPVTCLGDSELPQGFFED